MMNIIDALRTMWSHAFIVNAFLAGTFIAIAAGLVGYFVVLRNQVFVADAQSHTAFAGALAALAFGVDLRVGLFAATVIGAITMGSLGGSSRGRDVAIGTTFAWILGLGVLFLSLYTTSRSTGNGTAGVTILFGSIFGLSAQRAVIAAGVGLAGAGAMLAIARPLLFASVDPDVAASRGVPVRWLGVIFMGLVGVTIGEAVQAIGALLIFGLSVTPALTAQLLTPRPYLAMLVAVMLSLGAMWLGLVVSYAFPILPPSFVIVTLAFAVYLMTATGGAISRLRQRRDGFVRSESGMVAP